MNANYRRQLPYNNPLANVLMVVLGVIAIAISFVVGVVALISLVAAVIVLGAALKIRAWWQGRRGLGAQPEQQNPARNRQDNTVIEGEYQIVAPRKDQSEPPQT